MKKHTVLIILFLLGFQNLFANDSIEISLLTCSSGKETFTAWGHSALRIIDKEANIDVVYNFGLFDFDTPNFYLKFIKGKLKYKLGIHNTNQFYKSYLQENRQIIEQKLNLSYENKVKIIKRLEHLYRPENRYYYYSFVGKNCTSELRDLILENIETDFQNKQTEKTYRDELNEFLNDKLWVKFGMSLIMGYKIDKKVNLYESMFLPDYLYSEIRNIKTNEHSLVSNEQIINQRYNPIKGYPFFLNPFIIFSIILLLLIFIKSNFIQLSLQFIVGITGLIILVVSLYTEHPELQCNLNLLWINPFYLLVVILGLRKKIKLQVYLSIILEILTILMLFIWIFSIQDLDISFLPILFILSLLNFRLIKTKINFVR